MYYKIMVLGHYTSTAPEQHNLCVGFNNGPKNESYVVNVSKHNFKIKILKMAKGVALLLLWFKKKTGIGHKAHLHSHVEESKILPFIASESTLQTSPKQCELLQRREECDICLQIVKDLKFLLVAMPAWLGHGDSFPGIWRATQSLCWCKCKCSYSFCYTG